ncbi:MAG: hypothetical protein ACOYO1_03525 [Bacteroidales bacterium]
MIIALNQISVSVLNQTIYIQICEIGTMLDKYWLMEIRCKSINNHQTAIVTKHLSLETAIRQFS